MSTTIRETERVARLSVDEDSVELPLVEGTENERAVDIERLRAQTGLVTLDEGYRNTASVRSAITFINGEEGILRYRGIPIEQLAERSNFIETALLLIYGKLPTQEHLQRFRALLTEHEMIHEGMRNSFLGYPPSGHPMAILSSMINTLSCYNHDVMEMEDDSTFENAAARLLSKIRTVAAYAYRTSIGMPLIYPEPDYSYCRNFLHMMFSLPTQRHEPDPDIVRALSLFFILHADHEQNCSTSTVRTVGSSGANLFASCSAGVCALWGPRHGGANVAVIEQLERIHQSGTSVADLIERVKQRKERLYGFGHGVYRSYDPRAHILRAACDQGVEQVRGVGSASGHCTATRRDRVAGRLFHQSQSLSQRRLLFGTVAASDRHSHQHVHRVVRDRPHARLDRQLEGDARLRHPHF